MSIILMLLAVRRYRRGRPGIWYWISAIYIIQWTLGLLLSLPILLGSY